MKNESIMTGPSVNEAMMNKSLMHFSEVNHLTTELHETAFMQMA